MNFCHEFLLLRTWARFKTSNKQLKLSPNTNPQDLQLKVYKWKEPVGWGNRTEPRHSQPHLKNDSKDLKDRSFPMYTAVAAGINCKTPSQVYRFFKHSEHRNTLHLNSTLHWKILKNFLKKLNIRSHPQPHQICQPYFRDREIARKRD